jgi:DNA-binding MarR family transcriptional regulator
MRSPQLRGWGLMQLKENYIQKFKFWIILIPMKSYDVKYNKFVRIPANFLNNYQEIPASSIKILIYLYSKSFYYRDTQSYKPVEASYNDIIIDCNMKISTIKRSIKKLLELGIITKEKGNSINKKTVYYFSTMSNINPVKIELSSKSAPTMSNMDTELCPKTTLSKSNMGTDTPLKSSPIDAKKGTVETLSNKIDNNSSKLLLFEDHEWGDLFDKNIIERIEKIMKKFPQKKIKLYRNPKSTNLLKKALEIAPPDDNTEGAKAFRDELGKLILYAVAKGCNDDRIEPIALFLSELRKWIEDGSFSQYLDFSKTEELLKEIEYDAKQEREQAYQKQKAQELRWEAETKKIQLENEQRPLLLKKFEEKYPEEFEEFCMTSDSTASMAANSRRIESKTGFEKNEDIKKRERNFDFTMERLISCKIKRWLEKNQINMEYFLNSS